MTQSFSLRMAKVFSNVHFKAPRETGKLEAGGEGPGHVDRGREMRNEVISSAPDHKRTAHRHL